MTLEDKEKIKAFGYNPEIKTFPLDNDKIQFLAYLSNLLTHTKLDESPLNLTASDIVKQSQSFFLKFFTPQSVRIIPLEQDEEFLKMVENIPNPRKLSKKISHLTIKGSPFDIPIKDDKITNIKSYIINNPTHQYFRLSKYPLIPRENIIYRNISIETPTTIITPFSYTHEITHTQESSHQGAIKDYTNSEVLSIFMEKLHAYLSGQKEFLAVELERLKSLHNDLNYYRLFPFETLKYVYIESTIKAEILFYLFLSSEKMQKYILKSIQDIFSGFSTLEDLLKKLMITTQGRRKYQAVECNLSQKTK